MIFDSDSDLISDFCMYNLFGGSTPIIAKNGETLRLSSIVVPAMFQGRVGV